MKTEDKRAGRGMEDRIGEPDRGRWLLAETCRWIRSAWRAVGGTLTFSIGIGLMISFLLACSTNPPSRMDAYLNPSPPEAEGMRTKPSPPKSGGLTAGLMVINDTTAKGSAPSLSSQGLTMFTDEVRAQIIQAVPINVTKVLPTTGIKADGRTEQFILASREAGSDYLLLVLLSSMEMESPSVVDVGAGSESVQATTARNFSLVEIALLDGRTGAVLVRAHGRETVSLTSLNAGIPSLNYPTITRDGGGRLPWRGIQDSRDALRVAAGMQALGEAVLRFENAWDKAFPD